MKLHLFSPDLAGMNAISLNAFSWVNLHRGQYPWFRNGNILRFAPRHHGIYSGREFHPSSLRSRLFRKDPLLDGGIEIHFFAQRTTKYYAWQGWHGQEINEAVRSHTWLWSRLENMATALGIKLDDRMWSVDNLIREIMKNDINSDLE